MWWFTLGLITFLAGSFYGLTIHDVTIRGHSLNHAAYGVLALCSAFLIRSLFRQVIAERKISALGGHAPRFGSRLPLGIDFLIAAIREAKSHENLRFWQTLMSTYANVHRPTTLEVNAISQRIIFTIDEDNIKAILATQFQDYGKGERFHREWSDFLGDSIFTTDGGMWHASRQLIRPQFIKDRVSDLRVFERHVNVLLPLLASSAGAVNLVDIFFRYTLDAATDFLLGSSVQSLEKNEVQFADAFAEIQAIQSLIARSGDFKFLINRKRFNSQLKVMDDFIQPFIDRTLQLSPDELEKNSKTEEGYTFLHALAAFTRDPKVLRDQLAAVLLAGRDTTAMTLAWLFYELSRLPRVTEKLREEILQTVGADREPTYADLKNMKYLTHTINETLRLYPIVPYNFRVALNDTTIPRGGGPDGSQPVGVLAGTTVGYSTLAMQRRADIYPPMSDKFAHHLDFQPERWEHWTPKPWTYVPFNGGPRICIGQQFALTEVAYTTVRILQKYARLENRMAKPPGLKADIVLQPSDGVNVAFFT